MEEMFDRGFISALPKVTSEPGSIGRSTTFIIECEEADHSTMIGFWKGIDLVRCNRHMFEENA
jgi:hypothetical protein